MATFEYSVDGQSITTTKAGRLVSGTIGVNTVKFTFDSSWDGLEKWATFDPNPGKPYKQPLDANGECLIPGEVMGGITLRIGVFGLAEGQAYPTVWANKLPMEEGCYVDVPPSDWPEPSPLLEDVVKVSEQTFTDAQKAQARTNIGAAGSADMATALAGKVDKPVGATEGNVAVIGSNQNISDSGVSKDNLILAPQLASNNIKTDSVPYVYRQTGGGIGTGNREYDSIVGGTVAYNQMLQLKSSASTVNNVVFTPSSNGYVTAVGLASADADYNLDNSAISFKDHVYFFGVADGGASSTYGIYITGTAESGGYGTFFYSDTIRKLTASRSEHYRLRVKSGYDINIKFYPKIVDLTQMFGSTVADYLYTLETQTAGAGVALFRSLFPKPYYAYTATPSLESVSGLQSHKTVGFNLWDEDWETGSLVNGLPVSDSSRIRSKNFTPCFPNTAYNKYSHSGLVINIFWYDVNKNFLSYIGASAGQAVTSPQDAYYFKICTTTAYGGTYKHDICVNLSDPTRNGTYEPYEEHTYPLDSSLTLRGVAVTDADGNVKFDGDEYAPDGTVTRRYGIVDLGTLTWTKYSTEPNFKFYSPLPLSKDYANTDLAIAICSKYPSIQYLVLASNDKHFSIGRNGTRAISIFDSDLSSLDASGFKSAMSGVYLVYQLATPTTETAEPYESLQICDPFGTEEYVTTGIVPVGHNTRYPENQVAKLDGLPSDFSRIIAPTEIKFTATRTYTVGRLMIIHNVLYKAKTSIAIGATLTIGTNIEETTLDEVIASL